MGHGFVFRREGVALTPEVGNPHLSFLHPRMCILSLNDVPRDLHSSED